MTASDGKISAARAAVELIADGMVVGLGTGSTAAIALELIGQRVRDGLAIKGIPTSRKTARDALELGIPLITLDDCPTPDIDIDGADEVDVSLNLIKGGGGALLHEKIVAYAARQVVIIVDSEKVVEKLGKFNLPVEIVAFAHGLIQDQIRRMNGRARLRKDRSGAVLRTDEGNWILDCDFGLIDDPVNLARRLSSIPGIVEHGLFVAMADTVIIGDGSMVRFQESTRARENL
jgi:ribose 5-phosphate isomerase A